MTGPRVSGGRRLSVFFTAEEACQSQKKVIVLKQGIQAFRQGSEEEIHTTRMSCMLHVEMAVRHVRITAWFSCECENTESPLSSCGGSVWQCIAEDTAI